MKKMKKSVQSDPPLLESPNEQTNNVSNDTEDCSDSKANEINSVTERKLKSSFFNDLINYNNSLFKVQSDTTCQCNSYSSFFRAGPFILGTVETKTVFYLICFYLFFRRPVNRVSISTH